MNPKHWRLTGLGIASLAILMVAIFCLRNYRQYSRETLAIDAIRNLGGGVTFGEENGRPVAAEPNEFGETPPSLLLIVLGIRMPAKVVCLGNRSARGGGSTVSLRDSRRVTDDDLENVATLRGLEVVDLSNTSISERGLRLLRPISRLRVLTLDGTSIGDSAVDEICFHKHLAILDISRTAISESGIAAIREHLPKVKLRTSS